MGEIKVLDADNVASLIRALGLWWRLQDTLRLVVPSGLDEANIPDSTAAALARAATRPDFETLTAAMEEAYGRVSDLYRGIVDGPAEEARKRLPTGEDG